MIRTFISESLNYSPDCFNLNIILSGKHILWCSGTSQTDSAVEILYRTDNYKWYTMESLYVLLSHLIPNIMRILFPFTIVKYMSIWLDR